MSPNRALQQGQHDVQKDTSEATAEESQQYSKQNSINTPKHYDENMGGVSLIEAATVGMAAVQISGTSASPAKIAFPALSEAQRCELDLHRKMFLASSPSQANTVFKTLTSPLFSGPVLTVRQLQQSQQYGLIGQDLNAAEKALENDDNRMFMNIAEPSSTFICGSQGSGKSHTMSCMLENYLLRSEAS